MAVIGDKREEVQIRFIGLYTNPNPLDLKPGSWTACNNMAIDQQSRPGSRRGFKGAVNVGALDSPEMSPFNGYIFAHSTDYNTTGQFITLLSGTQTGGILTGDAVFAPNFPQYKMKFQPAKQNLYFATNKGIYRMDNQFMLNGLTAYYPAGALKHPGFDNTNTVVMFSGGAGRQALPANTLTNLPNGMQLTYRATILYKDQNGNVIEGSPSGRLTVSNTTANAGCPLIRMLVPTEATVNYYYRLYASIQVSNGTVPALGLAVTPSDEEQLVYEAYFQASDISNKFVDITEVTGGLPGLLGNALYTNPNTGDPTGSIATGVGAANEPPPLANDLLLYKDCMLYANCKSKQRLNLTLLAVQTATNVKGVNNTDTITIAGTTYTAVTGTPSGNQYKIVNTLTQAQNIEQTAQNLVTIINQTNANVYAYYQSGPNDLPGKILLETKPKNYTSFTVQVSANSNAWNPSTLATATASTQLVQQNVIYASKPKNPEAVPLGNAFVVGRDETAILKIAQSRESVFIFKEEGVFKLSGSDPTNFQVRIHDETVRLIARDTVQTLGSRVFALTNQGVVAISESGVQLVSGQIDLTLRNEIENVQVMSTPTGYTQTFDYARDVPFAISYETDKKYILCMPKGVGFVTCDHAYVYNYVTDTWCKWTFQSPWQTGCIGSAGYSASAVDDYLYAVDNHYGTGGYPNSYIYVERKTYTQADFKDDVNGGGGLTINQPINNSFTLAPLASGNPGALKLWSDVVQTYGAFAPTTVTFDFSSEITGDGGPVVVPTFTGAGVARTLVTQQQARCGQLTVTVSHSVAGEGFDITSLTLWAEDGGAVSL